MQVDQLLHKLQSFDEGKTLLYLLQACVVFSDEGKFDSSTVSRSKKWVTGCIRAFKAENISSDEVNRCLTHLTGGSSYSSGLERFIDENWCKYPAFGGRTNQRKHN